MRARGTNRGERECGEEGENWWEYLSESLTDYLYTYMLTSAIICFARFSFRGCGSASIATEEVQEADVPQSTRFYNPLHLQALC